MPGAVLSKADVGTMLSLPDTDWDLPPLVPEADRRSAAPADLLKFDMDSLNDDLANYLAVPEYTTIDGILTSEHIESADLPSSWLDALVEPKLEPGSVTSVSDTLSEPLEQPALQHHEVPAPAPAPAAAATVKNLPRRAAARAAAQATARAAAAESMVSSDDEDFDASQLVVEEDLEDYGDDDDDDASVVDATGAVVSRPSSSRRRKRSASQVVDTRREAANRRKRAKYEQEKMVYRGFNDETYIEGHLISRTTPVHIVEALLRHPERLSDKELALLRRIAKNRRSAAKHRMKQRDYVVALEKKKQDLTTGNRKLARDLDRLHDVHQQLLAERKRLEAVVKRIKHSEHGRPAPGRRTQ